MNLDIKRITEKIEQNDFIENFIKELSEAIERTNNKSKEKGEKMNNRKLTPEEDLNFYRKKIDFLQEFFKEELSDLTQGEIFIVTDKYENDFEYHRYKVAQYKDNKEWKYIAFEKDLPENVKLGDIVRKVDGKYIYDEKATKHVNDSIESIKDDIVNNRKN